MTLTATLVFYCSLKAPGTALTASGTPAIAWQTAAVDRSVIPKGSTLRATIPGVGPVTMKATDTGGKIKGAKVDVFVGYGERACARARQLGVIKTRVEVTRA